MPWYLQQALPSVPKGTLTRIQCAGDSLYVLPSFLTVMRKWYVGAPVISLRLGCSCSTEMPLLTGNQQVPEVFR